MPSGLPCTPVQLWRASLQREQEQAQRAAEAAAAAVKIEQEARDRKKRKAEALLQERVFSAQQELSHAQMVVSDSARRLDAAAAQLPEDAPTTAEVQCADVFQSVC